MRSFRHRRKLLFVKVAAVNQILAFASELERVKLGRTWPYLAVLGRYLAVLGRECFVSEDKARMTQSGRTA